MKKENSSNENDGEPAKGNKEEGVQTAREGERLRRLNFEEVGRRATNSGRNKQGKLAREGDKDARKGKE